jgi:peptide/nickel transport system ATP-binding protein/oligopeptide transport system ATP-binding protein
VSAPPPILEVEGLCVTFPRPGGRVPVLRDVGLRLAAGAALALVGESGSGKSMLCQALLGIVPPPGEFEARRLFWRGRDLRHADPATWREVRGAGMAMVFQDPTAALNPLMSIGRQIEDVVRTHGIGAGEARRRVQEVLREVGFPDPEQRRRELPSQLSGGLRQRVAIAMALAARPQLIIADEATTNLDVSIQAQIIQLFARLRRELGVALIFVTHDLALAAEVADEVLVLYAGHAVEQGPARQVLDAPAHPYTQALVASAPTLASRREHPLRPVPGTVPDPAEIGEGAPFRSRCPVVIERLCAHQKPGWTALGPGHRVACHRVAHDLAGDAR